MCIRTGSPQLKMHKHQVVIKHFSMTAQHIVMVMSLEYLTTKKKKKSMVEIVFMPVLGVGFFFGLFVCFFWYKDKTSLVGARMFLLLLDNLRPVWCFSGTDSYSACHCGYSSLAQLASPYRPSPCLHFHNQCEHTDTMTHETVHLAVTVFKR